jgi:hypothetical protein
MDVFAHTLWTNAVFYAKYARQRRSRYWAAFFGVLPDLVSFVPVFAYGILSGQIFQRAWYMQTGGVFDYGIQSYNYTHSAVVFLVVFLLVMLLRRGKPWWPLVGWLLHIVIDIFTHPDFFQTPFLFPLSDFRNTHAISWAHPWFMAINYACLLVVYILIWRYQRKRLTAEVNDAAAS